MWLIELVFFLNSANLICRSTDISNYFRESLGIPDNESRLYLNISPPNTENFQIENSDIFQNIDCGYSLEPPRRGGSNEYTQSTFPSKNKGQKAMYTPVNPSFTI